MAKMVKLPDRELTVQECLSQLRSELKIISERMKHIPTTLSDQSEYLELFGRQETLNKTIQDLQNSIQPTPRIGVISDFTRKMHQGPEPDRFKK